VTTLNSQPQPYLGEIAKMKIERDDEFRQQLLDKIAAREFHERIGTHQSDLVYCLNKQALRRLKPLPNTDEDVLLFSIGYATQRWLTGQDEDEPEKEVDGIIVTLDAVADGLPWELKASYMSANKSVEESIHYIRQVMAQCYVTKTLVGRLSKFELMGDYKWIFGKKEEKAVAKRPTLSAWKLEFTQKELDDFWEWLKERKKLFEGILETGKLLPPAVALASGMAWECGRCERRGIDCRKEETDV
jgi:hypothetical protein